MRINSTLTRTMFVASLMLIPWMLPGLSPASSPVKGDLEDQRSFEFQRSLEEIATDSVADSLKACLARIPSDSSAGQNMLAVDTCKQEDRTRRATIVTF